MENIKWGLTGCGDIAAKRVAPGLNAAEHSLLYSVNRSDYSLAESFARQFGARKWTKEWKDLVSDPDIDAVYIATPVFLHAEQAIAAAEAGKHVLCEKPMALDGKEARRMTDACRTNGVKLGVAYYRHFYPAVKRIKDILASGELGKPVLIQSNNFENFNREKGEPRYWLLEKSKSGGGPMMDMGCHRIEVFTNILGPVASVTAFNSRTAFEREVEDTSTAHFRMAAGAEGLLVSSHAPSEPRDSLDIYCTEGSVHVPVLNSGTILINSPAGNRTEEHPNPGNTHLPLIEDFIDSLLKDREPAVNGEAGLEVTDILDRIYSR